MRLTTTGVTSSEDTLKVGAVLAGCGLDVLASVLLNLVTKNTSLRSEETHSKQDEVSREELLRALDLLHVPATTGRLGPLNTDGVDALDLARAIVHELLGHDAVLTRVLASVLANLSVTVVNAVNARPLRPRVVVGTLRRRLGQKLEVGDRLSTVTERGSDTIVTSVTTTNDNNVLVLGRDVSVVTKLGVEKRLGVLVKELHSVVNTLELAALDREVTSNSSTSCNNNNVMAGPKVAERWMTLLTNCNTGLEDDTLVRHEIGTALDNTLVELHVGNTVHEETTQAVSSLIDSDKVTSAVELVSSSQTSRAGSNDRDSLASADLRRLRNHPTLLETPINDSTLDRFDADRVFVDTQNTSTLARSRADTAGELGEVVASLGLTERNTTIHATSRLVFELILVKTRAKLSPVLKTGVDRSVLLLTTLVHFETSGLVKDKGTLLLCCVVANSLLEILKLSSLLGLLVLDARDGRQVVFGTLSLGSLGCFFQENTLVVNRENLDESRKSSVKVDENASGALGASVVMVILNETANESNLSRVLKTAGLNHLTVELGVEIAVYIQDVGNTTRHTSCKVATSRSKNNDATTSHVLTTVVTDTLDNGGGTGVSDGETFSSNTTEEASTSSSTVQTSVTNENVLLRLEDSRAGRVDDQSTTRQALADVIVGITLKLKCDTRSEESTERLASRALDINMNSVHGQSSLAVSLGNVVREGGTHRSVSVDNVTLDSGWKALVESQLGLGDQLVVKSDVKLVVLLSDIEGGNARSELVSRGQEKRQVDVGCLVSSKVIAHLENLYMSNHLIDGTEAKLGHNGSKLVGDIVEEVDDMLGGASELLSELRVLSSDTNGAGVQVTLSHKDAAHGNKRSSGKAPFLGTKQTSKGNITTSLELSISLDNDTTTKIVQDQGLMSLSQTQLPRKTSILDASPSRSTGTTIVTRDQDVVGLRLGDTRGDDTDTNLRDKLDRDSRSGAGALQIVDQLLEILDGVNIVVRRGRDKTDTRGRVTGASNGLGHLVTRKLTTLTGLGTLSHLNLKLIRVGKVGRSDTESTRSDLLDGRTHGITVGHTLRSLRVLTTLTSVRLSTQSVHGNSQGRVRLHRDGTVRHGTGTEPANDISPRLNLINGDRSAVLKLKVQKTTESTVLDLFILGSGVGLVRLIVLGADSVLDIGDRGRVVDVRLTTVTPVVLARLRKTRGANAGSGRETSLVESESILSNELKGHTLDTRSSAPEASLNNSLIETKDLKDLSTLVGVDSISTVTEEDTHVMDLTSLSSLNNKSSHGSPLVADKVMVNHGRSQNSRNGYSVSRGVTIRQNNNTVPSLDGGRGLVADLVEMLDVALNSLVLGESQINSLDSPLGVLVGHVLDGIKLLDREDRTRKQETATLGGSFLLVGRHWSEQQADLLVSVAVGVEQRVRLDSLVIKLGRKIQSPLHDLNDLGQSNQLTIEPCSEIISARNSLLQFLVINDATSLCVDQQHTTRLKTALLDDTLRLNWNGSNLGSADDTIVVHDVETARSETVSVKVGTTVSTVSECEQSRAIPRLHLASSPLVECSLLGVHVLVTLPSFRNHEHNSLRKREDTVDGQKLENVVESS
ncbi:hypothetical protein HG531_013816 [Fusarium graminearum]|nr:hypothetical protein HG531_013816 [Fusarium graminearum]